MGCGYFDNAAIPHSPIDVSTELSNRTNIYLSLGVSGQWAFPDSCDGLLFSALDAVARDEPIDINLAEGQPGQWFRNPSHNCYDTGAAASDISRDMILGLMIYSVHFDRKDILEDLWSYGKIHKWNMGRGVGDGRTVLTPATIGRLARAIHYLGGIYHAEAEIPDLPSTNPGFVSHLTLLGILLDGKMAEHIDSANLDALHTIVSEEPRNPLAQALLHKYTDGDQSVASGLLVSIWPSDRLPTSADWCEEWRLQRADSDRGLQPCISGITHSGGDLLFVSSLIQGRI